MNALKLIFAVTTFCLSSLIFISTTQAKQTESELQGVDKIDLEKYAGDWYEIAHLPMFFQRHCASNTSAQYTLNSDKTITVYNRCRKDDGQMISATGVAYSQNVANDKLKVSFLPKGLRWVPFSKGDYWILRIDPEYKVVLVGDSSRKFLWILSRETQLDDMTYQSYLDTAKTLGYDLTLLKKTIHQ